VSDSDPPGISFVLLLFLLISGLEEAIVNYHQVTISDDARIGDVGNNGGESHLQS